MSQIIPNNLNHIAELHQVSKTFDDNKAVDNVSFNLQKGEVLALLGPNGAGKTTLINMMLGRLSLSSGQMKILNYQPGEIHLKRQTGALLQVTGLPDMSTVKEQIELFQSYYPAPMDFNKVIELTGLKSIQNQYCKTLSGGQKQRLLFALAICGDPKILFLDEPSVGMDIETRKSLWNTITQLKNKGTSILLTTHYLEEADQLSDRIIMLNHGKVIHEGTSEQIKARLNCKIIRFISSHKIHQFQQISSLTSIKASGKYFEIQSPDSSKTLRELFNFTDDINDLTITGAALEDAFIHLNQESQNTNNQEAA